MSTTSTIYLDEIRGVHIFHDLHSGNVIVEIDTDDNLHLHISLMKFDEWQRYIMYPPTSAERSASKDSSQTVHNPQSEIHNPKS